jgi:hypothetical protein
MIEAPAHRTVKRKASEPEGGSQQSCLGFLLLNPVCTTILNQVSDIQVIEKSDATSSGHGMLHKRHWQGSLAIEFRARPRRQSRKCTAVGFKVRHRSPPADARIPDVIN